MKDQRTFALPLVLLFTALFALVLSSATLQGGATVSAAQQTNTNPSRQVIRIGKATPTPTPTPAKKPTVIVGSPPPRTTAKPTPAPPARTQQGTGGAVRIPGPVTPQAGPPSKQPVDGTTLNAVVPNVAAELTASKFDYGEFKNYVKQQNTTGGLYFKLETPAKNAQKVVWQVSNQPFAKPKDGKDWKAPAGLITSGETPLGQPFTGFFIDFTEFLGPATQKPRFVYVRALAVNHAVLAARPSNDVVVNYSAGNSDVKVEPPKTPPPTANFSASVILYKPPIRDSSFASCRFILTQTPPTGELKFILEKIKATTPGARFSLCPGDYEELKKYLTPGEKITIAFQDFLKTIKAGYNWLDDKYNYVENKLVAGLESAGVPYAREAINYYKMIYGLNMSYGNFDESLDHGKKAFAAHLANSGGVSDKDKPSIIAKFNQFVDEVKHQANGGGDPSRFYRRDPDFVPRPAYAVVRVKCQASSGAPPDLGCKKSTVRVKFDTTANDPSTISSVHPQVTLFDTTVEVPAARQGETIDVPVYLNDTPLYKSDPTLWNMGYINPQPGKLSANGNAVLVVAHQKYPK